MGNVTIKHRLSRKERSVSEREWETIQGNPLLADKYTVVSKAQVRETPEVKTTDKKIEKSK